MFKVVQQLVRQIISKAFMLDMKFHFIWSESNQHKCLKIQNQYCINGDFLYIYGVFLMIFYHLSHADYV